MTPFETRASLAPQGEVGGAGERPGVVLEAAMSDNVHKGGCACGRVSVEARGEPYRVGVCHCLTCRKLHGMPFSFYAVFPTDAVTITGKVDVFASSEHGRRYFCPACGSQVWSQYSRPDEMYVYPGSFDETGLWEPTYELWTIRRDPWLPAFPSVVNRYEKDRPKWSRTEPSDSVRLLLPAFS